MIKKFLSNAMLSIVMDKSAKEKYHAVKERRKSLKKTDKISAEDALIQASLKPDTKPEASADREELLKNAMDVFNQKSKVFDDLSPNQKQRLQLLAMHTMLGKDKG